MRAPVGGSLPYAGEVLAEQAKVVYRHLPPLLVINALVAGAMAYGLWDVVAHRLLLVWLAAMLLMIVLRFGLYAAYRRGAGPRPAVHWLRGFTTGSAAAGVLWGGGAVVFFPAESLQHVLFILFVLVGMGAGAVSSLTAYMPAFYAYVPASLLPVSVLLFRTNTPIDIALGVMTIVYVAALIFFGRNINRSLVESLSLRFANIDLVNQLSEQRDEAQRANVGKSKFLAAASHDLRQPLHALALFTSALDEQIKYPETRRIVDNINAAVRALDKLFHALLDISRLDAGVLKPQMRDFALHDFLAALINEYTPEADAKKLALRYEGCDLVVRSDPALLERILRNYLSNAIRYTKHGEVRVACATDGAAVRIDVVDTGVGIPASQHRAIFDEFHQLGNPERDRTQGLGLGLAIVDRVARLLGHAIDLDSSPGRGARFSVSVPLGDRNGAAREEAAAPDDPRRDLAGLCVIVVDDEISVREGMATLLQQWGCRAITAAAEDEAVAAVAAIAARPDVIVVDYRLRGERTGVEAVARLRAEFGAGIPALIVTGDTAPERLREAAASGHPLVHKPVQPAVLRRFLRNARRTAAARSEKPTPDTERV